MYIHNIRFGFACNSSSTHSCILFFPEGHKLEDVGDVISDGSNDYYSEEIGNFVLASRQAKLGYIGALLQDAVHRDSVPEYIWDYYVKNWLESVAVNRDAKWLFTEETGKIGKMT